MDSFSNFVEIQKLKKELNRKLDVEQTLDGDKIGIGTIPINRIEENVATQEFVEKQIASIPKVKVTSDIPIHLSITDFNGLRITYNDGQ